MELVAWMADLVITPERDVWKVRRRWDPRRWEVVGWRASGDHVRLVREQLANGMPLPEPIPSDPNDPGGPP